MVVAVLHGEEAAGGFDALLAAKQLAFLDAAVRDVNARRLIGLSMGNGGGVSAEGDKAGRLSGTDVECPDAVQRIELGVKRVATILGRKQLVVVDEGKVVERVVV